MTTSTCRSIKNRLLQINKPSKQQNLYIFSKRLRHLLLHSAILSQTPFFLFFYYQFIFLFRLSSWQLCFLFLLRCLLPGQRPGWINDQFLISYFAGVQSPASVKEGWMHNDHTVTRTSCPSIRPAKAAHHYLLWTSSPCHMSVALSGRLHPCCCCCGRWSTFVPKPVCVWKVLLDKKKGSHQV